MRHTRPARIRAYQHADRAALYDICLRTGDAGGDATGRYADPELLGHVYLGAYLACPGAFAFVLDDGAAPVGYAVGVADTVEFERWREREWWPPLRRRYPDPSEVPEQQRTADQQQAWLIHHPVVAPWEVTAGYPAHLHIDLLPQVQGRGYGRRLLTRLLVGLARAGAAGVHLGVDPANPGAAAFYRRLGFTPVGGPHPHLMVAKLPGPARSG